VSTLSEPALWVRVGGGLQELGSGQRHGPADPDFPPPGGPWSELRHNGRLIGWAPEGMVSRGVIRRAEEDGARLILERRAYLVRRLGHKVRSSVLALQVSARQAAFGRQELFEEILEQALDVGLRAFALTAVALDPTEAARSVVLGAALNLAAPGAERTLPPDALVRAPETVLVDALTKAYEWMGGPGTVICAQLNGRWWRLELQASPHRRPLAIPELGEPLVRHLVDTHLDGWLDAGLTDRVRIHLPAG
jgi:hypothetical protein